MYDEKRVDCLPTTAGLGNWKKLLSRAINKNQLLILSYVSGNSGKSLTKLLTELGSKESIALSTLKFNARILRDLGLIEFNGTARVTRFGKYILDLMGY